jgi:hypothetical protein
MNPFTKIVRPGVAAGVGSVFCKIEWDGKRLAITGVEGPTRDGNCAGSCGQINKPTIHTYATGWNAKILDKFFDIWGRWHLNNMRAGCEHQRADGWRELAGQTAENAESFGWGRDYFTARLRAERGQLTAEEYADYSARNKAVSRVTTAIDAPKHRSLLGAEELELVDQGWIVAAPLDAHKSLRGWLKPSEHPDGLLCRPCDVCGYRYGAAWLHEDVPASVLKWLVSLPNADSRPAWV